MGPGGLYALIVGGLAAAVLALLLRRQELRHPAMHDIRPKGGLGHMLVGVMAGLALTAISVAAVFATGIVLPVALALGLVALVRLRDPGPGLAPLYPFKMPLAAAALIAALLVWITVIALTQGAFDA